MIEFIVSTILALGLYLVLICYLIPKQRLSRYAQTIRDAGYDVVELPFAVFNSSYRQQFIDA